VLFRVTVASVALPFLNVTVPVAVPDPGALAVTVAVKVTTWPLDDGLGDDVRVVVVPSLLTVWVMAAEELLLKLLSPL
jgi:hypothetical protein